MLTTETNNVTTPEECAAFIHQVGICTWRRAPKLPALPSVEEATPWRGQAFIGETWFWKDDLHCERQAFFGPLLGASVLTFVAPDWLPTMIAAQGDNDPQTLFEQGRLASNALQVYEHVTRNGPTSTARLPWPPGSRHLYLASLQQVFLLTKVGLTGRTRGTYGYVWGLCDEFWPDAFAQAARLAVADARAQLIAHLAAQDVPLSPTQAARLFHWHGEN